MEIINIVNMEYDLYVLKEKRIILFKERDNMFNGNVPPRRMRANDLILEALEKEIITFESSLERQKKSYVEKLNKQDKRY